MSKEQAMEPITPFLKWAGGKRWLTSHLNRLIPSEGGTYFEPFLGGAAMFFYSRPLKAVLSDKNAALIEAYSAIKNSCELVERHLRQHAGRHTNDYYYDMRSRVCRTKHTRAAQFIYLNRTCWNGLYRVNRHGEFNVPRGTKTKVILDDDDFEIIAQSLQSCELVCSDFEAQIDRAKRGDVVFADPPYTVRHKHNGFVKYNEVLFGWEDQIRLRDVLLRAKERGAKIILTNADHLSIRSLYQDDFSVKELSRYSAISGLSERRGRFPELLIS